MCVCVCVCVLDMFDVFDVFDVFDRVSSGQVAIKRLMMEGSHETMLSLLAAEVNVLRRLRHPHIVQFLGLYRSKQEPTVYNIIMEYIDGGALVQLLNRMGKFPEAYAAAIVKQILHGLVYLHNQQIIHRYALIMSVFFFFLPFPLLLCVCDLSHIQASR